MSPYLREYCMAVRGRPWMKRYHRPCIEHLYACILVSRSKSIFLDPEIFRSHSLL